MLNNKTMSSKILLKKIVEIQTENNILNKEYDILKYKYKELKNRCNKLEEKDFHKFIRKYPHVTNHYPVKSSSESYWSL